MKKKKITTNSVLKFEEASKTKRINVSRDYLSKYSGIFDKKYAENFFIRREAGALHNTFEWGCLIYECVKNGNKKKLYEILYKEKKFKYGVLSNDKLRSVKDLIICLVSVIVQFSLRDRILSTEEAFTAGDTCIQMVEETENIDEVLMQAYTSLDKICDLIDSFRKSNYHPLVAQAEYYYEQHAHEKIKISDMARELDISREYLSRVFRETKGCTLHEYIINRKVESAKQMLEYSDMSVSEISKYLGFSSQSYFSEVFRSETGYTPIIYRKSILYPLIKSQLQEDK